MGLLHGIPVSLTIKTVAGKNNYGETTYTETTEIVNNVIVGEPSTQEITDTMNLYGKMLAYTLAIPKGDTHDWTDTTVEFFGEKFKTIGAPTQGIEDMIPLSWNKKVKVVRYEQSAT